jgi:uncharacterized protein YjbI with pentapeptide repeats
LRGADLRGANLIRAEISSALMAGTNFEGATLPDGSIQD